MRLAIILVGALATGMALTVTSVYALWFLSGDLVYVLLFPQLVSVVYLKDFVNTYGSFAAYCVGVFLRVSSGEKAFGIPVYIEYPFYDADEGQLFPFRTFIMAMSFVTILAVSGIAHILFKGTLPLKYDIFKCFTPVPPDKEKLKKQQRDQRRLQEQVSTSQDTRSQYDARGSDVQSQPSDVLSGQPREMQSSPAELSGTADKQPDVLSESPDTVTITPEKQPKHSSKGSKKAGKRRSKTVVSSESQDESEH